MKLIQPMIRKEEQQSDRFLDYFYKKCASSLYAPLLENVPEHKNVTSASLPHIDAHSILLITHPSLSLGALTSSFRLVSLLM
jgi:hypothetical protein